MTLSQIYGILHDICQGAPSLPTAAFISYCDFMSVKEEYDRFEYPENYTNKIVVYGVDVYPRSASEAANNRIMVCFDNIDQYYKADAPI